MYRLTLISGDGIGPEISKASRSVLQLIHDRLDVKFEITDVEAGDSVVRNGGKALPDHSFQAIKNSDACIKAPIGESAADVIVYLRRTFDLYANIRPAKNYPNIKGLKENIDMVIVRENTEDVYAGLEYDFKDASIAIRLITKKASSRIAEHAFKLARFRNKKKIVTAVHKANLLRKTDGLFSTACREVSKKYADINFSEMYVDACAMNMIRNPENFDVIVTTNLFGDILSDEAAQVVGSLGIAPAANIGDSFAIFEPVHGSAPDIAGKGMANPLSMVLSVRMMLDWLAMENNDSKCVAAAQKVEDAVMKVLAKGIKTPDIGGKNKTDDVTNAVILELRSY
ncbi:MAG: isocitrate/isopropylmalate dehydrogenase family protein [Nitrososphaerales archaeon]